MVLGIFTNDGQMAEIIRVTHSPGDKLTPVVREARGRILTSNPCLNTIPNTSHGSSVEDWP